MPREIRLRRSAQKLDAFFHLASETLQGRFGGDHVGVQFSGTRNNVASLAHGEVAEERNDVGRAIDQQHAAEADVVVDKSHDGAGDEPASLHAGKQKRIRVDESFTRREFLDKCRDGRPEHPEAGGNQHVHGVKFPDLYAMGESQQGDHENNYTARGVEQHDQPAPVFAVNHYASERKQQQGRDGLHDRKRAERDFGMCGLQNVPGDSGSVHAAAEHGN